MAETQHFRARKATDPGDGEMQAGTLAPQPLIEAGGPAKGGWTEWVGLLGFAMIAAGIVWAAVWFIQTFFVSKELQGQRKLGIVGTFLWIAALIVAGVLLRSWVGE